MQQSQIPDPAPETAAAKELQVAPEPQEAPAMYQSLMPADDGDSEVSDDSSDFFLVERPRRRQFFDDENFIV